MNNKVKQIMQDLPSQYEYIISTGMTNPNKCNFDTELVNEICVVIISHPESNKELLMNDSMFIKDIVKKYYEDNINVDCDFKNNIKVDYDVSNEKMDKDPIEEIRGILYNINQNGYFDY